MEKGTASIFGATVVITVAIIGGMYLLDRAQRSAQPGASEEGGWTTLFSSLFSENTGSSPSTQNTPSSSPSSRKWQSPLSSSSRNASTSPSSRNGQSSLSSSSRNGQSPYPGPYPGPTGNSSAPNTQNVPPETSSVDGVLVCEHPEHGTVYTNAATCDEADLNNRLSIADSFVPIPGQDRDSGDDYQKLQDAANNSRKNRQPKNQKPNLRLHAKSPPSGLNVSCKFSVGKALEFERTLAASGDPRKSTWRDSYCKQRCEAIKEACPVADDYFYYRFHNVCGGSEYGDCWYQASR